MDENEWEERVAEAWASLDRQGEQEFLELIEEVAGEAPAGSAAADFERAAAFDSTGHSDLAVPLIGKLSTRASPVSAAAGRSSSWRARCAISGRWRRASPCSRKSCRPAPDHLDDARGFLAAALVDTRPPARSRLTRADRARPAPPALPALPRELRPAAGGARLGLDAIA